MVSSCCVRVIGAHALEARKNGPMSSVWKPSRGLIASRDGKEYHGIAGDNEARFGGWSGIGRAGAALVCLHSGWFTRPARRTYRLDPAIRATRAPRRVFGLVW